MVHIYDHKGQHLPTYGPHLWKIQKDSQNLPDLHVHQCVMARWRGGGGGRGPGNDERGYAVNGGKWWDMLGLLGMHPCR